MSALDLLSQLGLFLVILGLILLLIPLIVKAIPKLENLPPILLYVYRGDGFTFVTSPLLIMIFILLAIFWWLR
ncbi:MAG: hypothetical protein J7K45_00070 [Thaumarchaeota archaeon]|nr:hypothetical protein [Nitrososphaerota archaeon]